MQKITLTETPQADGVRFDFSDNSYNYIVVPYDKLHIAHGRIESFFKKETSDLIFSDIAHFVKK